MWKIEVSQLKIKNLQYFAFFKRLQNHCATTIPSISMKIGTLLNNVGGWKNYEKKNVFLLPLCKGKNFAISYFTLKEIWLPNFSLVVTFLYNQYLTRKIKKKVFFSIFSHFANLTNVPNLARREHSGILLYTLCIQKQIVPGIIILLIHNTHNNFLLLVSKLLVTFTLLNHAHLPCIYWSLLWMFLAVKTSQIFFQAGLAKSLVIWIL